MSPPIYRVTLVQLTPEARDLAPASEKLELGLISDEEVYRLAENFLALKTPAQAGVEPGILVQRGEKGWRITVHAGRLRVYKSTSLYDEYWTVENSEGLASLPPFIGAATAASGKTAHGSGAPKRNTILRSLLEVTGLFALAVGLILVGFKFGLPQRKLSDLPPDVIIVTADSERASVFTAVAGSYITGKKPGDSFVTITPEGRVLKGRIGKDGKPANPEIEEQARAARKGDLAVIVTSFGNIAEFPPDAVNVGSIGGSYRWRRL